MTKLIGILRRCPAVLLAAGVLLAACSRQSEPAPGRAVEEPGPELREAGRLWCQEHNRYEDRCWICHPELQDKARAAAESPPGELMCREHGVPEPECGICHPELAGQLGPGESLMVRLPSRESAKKAGVAVARPGIAAAGDAVEAYGEIVFDQNRVAQIVAPVEGIVQTVEVDLGDRVGERDVVARLWSATLGEAAADAVLARQDLARQKQLYDERVSPERDLQQAEAAYYAAYQHLRTLGFEHQQIEELSAAPGDAAVLPLRSPVAGEIVGRDAVRGVLVEPGERLFTVADRRTMWVELDVPEADLSRLREGLKVEFSIESLPGRTFTGKLTWIAAEVDERTRMARARAEVPNPGGMLRAAMFARARILVGDFARSLVVPEAAVQRIGGRSMVFVKIEEDLYAARAVRLGPRQDGVRVIVEGLRPDDPVVVAGSFTMKSQLLISRLGAGCVD